MEARNFSWTCLLVQSCLAYPITRRFSSRSRFSNESSAGNNSRAARSPDAPSTTSVGSLLMYLSTSGQSSYSGSEQLSVGQATEREPPRNDRQPKRGQPEGEHTRDRRCRCNSYAGEPGDERGLDRADFAGGRGR